MTQAMEFPLVITTAFAPKSDVPYLALKQGDVRNQATIYSIVWWLCKSNFSKILVVDTTGYDAIASTLENLAVCCGKTLEYIAVENDYQAVSKFGKGYGEGAALDRAYDQSKILQDCAGFFKCTGKIIVENYLECADFAKTKEFYFDAPRTLKGFVDTRFYFASKDFWLRNLRSAYKNVHDAENVFLEHAYYEAIAKVSRVPFNPIVIRYAGVSGTSGDSYGTTEVRHAVSTIRRRIYALLTRKK